MSIRSVKDAGKSVSPEDAERAINDISQRPGTGSVEVFEVVIGIWQMLLNSTRGFRAATENRQEDEDWVRRDEEDCEKLQLGEFMWPAIEEWERRRDRNNEPGKRQQ